MKINQYIKMYQEEMIPERFNKDLINLKEKENILDYIDDVCEVLEFIPYIKYLGSEIIKEKVYNFSEVEKKNSIESSRLELIQIHFRIDFNGETEYIDREIYFPVMKDSYFLIRGKICYTIWQMVENCYTINENILKIKTFLQPIDLVNNETSMEDTQGNIYAVKNNIKINLFKNELNFLQYFFAKFSGFDGTMKFMNLQNKIFIVDKCDEKDTENVYFSINKNMFVKVSKGIVNNNHPDLTDYYRNVIFNITELFNSRSKMDKLNDEEYWNKQLGKHFTKNTSNQYQKGLDIINSFERVLDPRTKKILRIPEAYKQDTFSFIKYLLIFFNKIISQDSMNLENKRIRLYEYLTYPLLMKFSMGYYRISNSKTLTMDKLKSIFNLKKGLLISKLIKSELIRYFNNVSSIDLFNVTLRFTQSGPQGMSNKVKPILRDIHPSYVNRISLITTSTNNPGITGSLTPFLELKDNYHFTENPEYINDLKK